MKSNFLRMTNFNRFILNSPFQWHFLLFLIRLHCITHVHVLLLSCGLQVLGCQLLILRVQHNAHYLNFWVSLSDVSFCTSIVDTEEMTKLSFGRIIWTWYQWALFNAVVGVFPFTTTLTKYALCEIVNFCALKLPASLIPMLSFLCLRVLREHRDLCEEDV